MCSLCEVLVQCKLQNTWSSKPGKVQGGGS